MKEETAKTKWCPQAANSKIFGVMAAEMIAFDESTETKTALAVRTGEKTSGIEKCIASDCMMWVWDLKLLNPEAETNGLLVKQYQTDKTSGHCGLARSAGVSK